MLLQEIVEQYQGESFASWTWKKKKSSLQRDNWDAFYRWCVLRANWQCAMERPNTDNTIIDTFSNKRLNFSANICNTSFSSPKAWKSPFVCLLAISFNDKKWTFVSFFTKKNCVFFCLKFATFLCLKIFQVLSRRNTLVLRLCICISAPFCRRNTRSNSLDFRSTTSGNWDETRLRRKMA